MPKNKGVDAGLKTVDDHDRIGIPKHISSSIPWLSGKTRIPVHLMMLRTDRYRVITEADMDSTPTLVAMRENIADTLTNPHATALSFADDASTLSALRLLETELSPPPPEWRIRLPRIIVDLLQVRPGREEVVVVLDRQFIEIWSVERFRSAFQTTLAEPE